VAGNLTSEKIGNFSFRMLLMSTQLDSYGMFWISLKYSSLTDIWKLYTPRAGRTWHQSVQANIRVRNVGK